MKSIEIKAPAKINIGLNIVSKRDDGYHNLETLFYPIHDLFDRIRIEKADTFSFSSDSDSMQTDETNLIVKTVKLLESKFHLDIKVKIYLEKVIPVGAGLGGGSSDAAAMLISLNDMYRLDLTFERLIELALQLGSDVPFFIKAKPAVGKSRGEILKFIEWEIQKPILIVNPRIHISTTKAFKNIQPKPNDFNYENIPVILKDNFFNLRNKVINDFEKNIFEQFPKVKLIKDKLYEAGAEFALMSGSGSTVFGIFETCEKAKKAQTIFPEEYFSFISHHEK